jgi:alkylhydroperoxidase/carboxymuconolactone decarboxylase family protein YurZ
MDDQRRRDQGMSARRAVLGDPHVDRAIAATTDLTADFQDLITRYAWGEIWTRRSGTSPRPCMTVADHVRHLRPRGGWANRDPGHYHARSP